MAAGKGKVLSMLKEKWKLEFWKRSWWEADEFDWPWVEEHK